MSARLVTGLTGVWCVPWRRLIHRCAYPLFIGEPKPLSFELLLEHTVLFDEIIDDRLLLAVKPAGQHDYEEVEGVYDRGHCPNRIASIFSDNNILRLVRIFAPYAVKAAGGG